MQRDGWCVIAGGVIQKMLRICDFVFLLLYLVNNNLEMNKIELRKKYILLRQAILADDADQKSLLIANNVLKMELWNNLYFHIFLPIETKNEVNTEFILHILHGKDKEIVVSKSDFETQTLTHYLLTDNTVFQKNKYQIPEPTGGLEVPTSLLEVVFVPLLGYDLSGNRVGYGKGFYDRFLANCKPSVVKIGLSFFEPENQIDDIEPTDIKLDFCVSPTAVYHF